MNILHKKKTEASTSSTFLHKRLDEGPRDISSLQEQRLIQYTVHYVYTHQNVRRLYLETLYINYKSSKLYEYVRT